MKNLIFTTIAALGLAAGIALATASPAAAWTCSERAKVCNARGGGTQCFESVRLKQCQAQGFYSAPSGRTWPVDGKSSCTKDGKCTS